MEAYRRSSFANQTYRPTTTTTSSTPGLLNGNNMYNGSSSGAGGGGGYYSSSPVRVTPKTNNTSRLRSNLDELDYGGPSLSYGDYPSYNNNPYGNSSYPITNNISTATPAEIAAEKELQELAKSTERLVDLGNELLQFATKYSTSGPPPKRAPPTGGNNSNSNLLSTDETAASIARGISTGSIASSYAPVPTQQQQSSIIPTPKSTTSTFTEPSSTTTSTTKPIISTPAHVNVDELKEEQARRQQRGSGGFTNQQPASAATTEQQQPPILPSPPTTTTTSNDKDDIARIKREHLAKRGLQQSQRSVSIATVTTATSSEDDGNANNNNPISPIPQPPSSSMSNNNNTTNNSESENEYSPKRNQPPQRPARPVIIPTNNNDGQPSSEVNNNADVNDDVDESSQDRATRYANMAKQAATLRAGGPSMALVPFGKFLLEAQGSGAIDGSTDDADRTFFTTGERPPPEFETTRKVRSHSDLSPPTSSAALLEGNNARKLKSQAVSSRANSSNGKKSSKTTTSTAASTSSTTISDQLLSSPETFQGYLYKTSGPKGFTGKITWKRRFFILTEQFLTYKASMESSTIKRKIQLTHVDVITEIERMPRNLYKPHAIALYDSSDNSLLTLCASSHGEILSWYQKIIKNISILCILQPHKLKKGYFPKMEILQDRTAKSYEQIRREELIAKHKAELPEPPQPLDTWFYPHYQLPPSYYDILGVAPDAESGVIRKRYYKIAKDNHPDRSSRNLDKEEAQQNSNYFAQVALAYETLIDPKRRAEYDTTERIKENLRRGVDCVMYEASWSLDDLELFPKDRILYNVKEKPVTIFCDGELRCLFWQDASRDPNILLPLRPSKNRSIELRFVQQILYARDCPLLAETRFPPMEYEKEDKFVIQGDRLHTGVLVFRMNSPEMCRDMINGLRMARCEKSMLFKQRLEKILAPKPDGEGLL
jgi:hypothetical protein